MTSADYGFIEVRGARENNLKDISLDIPKRKITLFTGVPGARSHLHGRANPTALIADDRSLTANYLREHTA